MKGLSSRGPAARLGVAHDEGEPPISRGADAVVSCGADPSSQAQTAVREPGQSRRRRAWREQSRLVGEDSVEPRERRREHGAPRASDGTRGDRRAS